MTGPAIPAADILLVEDQESIRFLVAETFAQANFKVREASSGRQALESIRKKTPDLVVLDVVMPEMDGFAVCKAIRADPALAHLPVLVMTSLEDEDSINQAYAVGATDFISKPFKNVVIVNRVRYMLRAYQTEQKAHRLAFFDKITGLGNAELFKDSLEHAVTAAQADNQPLALICLELPDFKRIRETMGQATGNRLIVDVAQRLEISLAALENEQSSQSALPPNLIARSDANQFALLLTDPIHADHVALVAQRIVDDLDQPFFNDDQEVFFCSRIGIAIYPKDAPTAEQLHECAATALNHARDENNTNFQFFNEAMADAARHLMAMDNKLRRALERNELSVWYQPQIDHTGKVCGLEALLRWTNAELGAVSPVDFIPLAEENGSIAEIGEWVLRTACLQAARWREQGLEYGRMAVNISALQFAQPEFVSLVQGILKQSGLQGPMLELEITESLLMKNSFEAKRTLDRLKRLGTLLAIDDFGTGYSSLSYLKKFPVDRLKIDRSFVNDITTDADDAAIAIAVMGMAANMNLEVIAEGVETEAQMAFLRERGCLEYQGYFISAPLDLEATTAYLVAANKARTNADSAADANQVLLLLDELTPPNEVAQLVASLDHEVITVTTQKQAFELLIETGARKVICKHGESAEFLHKLGMLFCDVEGVDLTRQNDLLIASPEPAKPEPDPAAIEAALTTLQEAFFRHEAGADSVSCAPPLRRFADHPQVELTEKTVPDFGVERVRVCELNPADDGSDERPAGKQESGKQRYSQKRQ